VVPPQRTCERCQTPLPVTGSGRPARWCSDACRVAAHRARQNQRSI
jgi:hypothetical protein